MALPGDDSHVDDKVWASLVQGLTPETMPRYMADKFGHKVEKQIVKLPRNWNDGTIIDNNLFEVVFYWCGGCLLVWRYQELSLFPGDEGLP